MLFPDLSAPSATQFKSSKTTTRSIAPVADRFLSLLLDFLLFSPVIGVAIASLIRQGKISFLIYSQMDEALAYILFLTGVVFVLGCSLQVLFLYFYQATPGQLFSKIRVVSYPASQEKLSLNQCLLRSVLWWISGAAFFLPFLEILSHPLRRTFFDRASDTMVVSLKLHADSGPHPIESRFFASWMRMSFLVLLGMGLVGGIKTYRSLLAGNFRVSSAEILADSVCPKNLDFTAYKGLPVLDVSLTLFMADAISRECLIEKADKVLWSKNESEEKDFAYLAKYMAAAEPNHQKQYLAKTCEKASSDACQLAKYMNADGTLEQLKDVRADLYFSKFLMAEELFLNKEYSLSLKFLKQLQTQQVFNQSLEKKYVRTIWGLSQQAQESANRSPASETTKELEDFKERYDLP